MRYLIASIIPNDIATNIRHAYEQAFHQPLPVDNLHVTLIPTFTLNAPLDQFLLKLNAFPIKPFDHPFTFGQPANFSNQPEDSILYLPIIPREPLDTLHQNLTQTLDPLITYDLTVYPNHQLPTYVPHLSLDYHFHPNLHSLDTLTPPRTLFPLTTINLLHEPTPNTWEVYTTFQTSE